MITRVMSWTALPGKGLEVVAVLKEVAALSGKINGVAPVVATTVGGAIGEVSLIAQAESAAIATSNRFVGGTCLSLSDRLRRRAENPRR